MHDLESFNKISGLCLNNRKTEALWIGAYTGRKESLCPEKNLKWVKKNKVKALGVYISTDPTTSMNENYNEKLEKVRTQLSCWDHRRLTLLGKMVVLKSLIASQLDYILFSLPTNRCAIDEINTMFYNFLWNGKDHKIKLDVIISDYENEGLKMIDLKSLNKAIKSTWVKIILR